MIVNNIISILLGCLLCGCYTNKITVIDAHTLQPVPNALVLTDKHYIFTRHVRAYKTNKNGIVHIDYTPTAIPFASLEITNDACILTRNFLGFVVDKYILSFSDIEYVSVG